MWYRCLLVLFISFFTFSYSVDASVCDNDHIKQLKEMASKIEVNYEYIDNSDKINEELEYSVNTYLVSINLLSDELYLNDGYKDYYYADSDNGTISFYTNSGSVKFIVYSSRCVNMKLRTISMRLPKFNTYSYREECKELEEYNLDVCDPWYQGVLNDTTFNNIVSRYFEEEDKDSRTFINDILNFWGNYYLYILGGLLLIILIIVVSIIHRKRSVLE